MMFAARGGTIFAWWVRDTHWSRAGLPLAAGLLLLAPLVGRRVNRATFLVYLQLPAYMLHQYEEHAHGAFKRAANRILPANIGHFTDSNIFWSNVLGVWGTDGAALALARYVGPGAGLVAPYVAIVNGLLHVAMALRTRRYNPGLWTALLLLLPVGGYGARTIARSARSSSRAQAGGLGAALLLHLLVILSAVLSGRQRRAGR